MNTNKVIYTIEEANKDIIDLARQVERNSANSGTPTAIAGIVRGGLYPAMLLSQWFDVPMFAVHYSLRDHKIQHNTQEMLEFVSQTYDNLLIVDDICDSGVSLSDIAKMLTFKSSFIRFATLHHNIGQTKFEPDFYVREINKVEEDVWIDYPWEEFWKR